MNSHGQKWPVLSVAVMVKKRSEPTKTGVARMLYPSYLNLYESGELAHRAEIAWEILKQCTICPQNCRCNRIAGKTGVCRSGTAAIVASWNIHRRAAPPITGSRG